MQSRQTSSGAVRWMAFDAVGTLIYAEPPVHVVYWEHAHRAGSRLSLDEIRERSRRVFSRELREAPLQTDEGEEYRRWKAIVAAVLHDIPVDSCFEDLFAHFGDPHAWRCYPDAIRLLRVLQQQAVPVLIASNFDARLDRVCAGHASLHWIRDRVISSQVGVRKPHPDFYRHLVARAGCAADEILMIGDDFRNDVEAAREAGLRALHLERKMAEPAEPTASPVASPTAIRPARSLIEFAINTASIDSLDAVPAYCCVASAGRLPDDPGAGPRVARSARTHNDDAS